MLTVKSVVHKDSKLCNTPAFAKFVTANSDLFN